MIQSNDKIDGDELIIIAASSLYIATLLHEIVEIFD